MNNYYNYYNNDREIEIDLIDVFWKLLMQWKAILIVCLITAILVPGIKYAKDKNEYESLIEAQKKSEEEASLPVNERIDNVLSPLSDDEKANVLFALHQEELLEQQRTYLNNSILMNTDPSHQRQLSLKYLIRDNSDMNVSTIAEAYSALIRRDEIISTLGEIIDPEADNAYIYELVSTSTDKKTKLENEPITNILTVTVVLPNDADGDKVCEIIDSAIEDAHSEITASSGEHSIQRIDKADALVYSTDTVEIQSDINERLSDLKGRVSNAESSLSDEGKAALYSIKTIEESAKNNEVNSSKTVPPAPNFSKKYALIGFLIGGFLYACVYLVLILLSKSLSSASVAQSYTSIRLLGEIYRIKGRTGLSKLLADRNIIKRRYKDKLDIKARAEAIADNIVAVCAHNEINSLAFLKSGVDKDFNDIVEIIIGRAKATNMNLKLDFVDADSMGEIALTPINNAIYVVTSTTRADKLGSIMNLCNDYDVTAIGTLYMEEL